MSPEQEKIAFKAACVATGGVIGTTTAATGHTCAHLQRAGLIAPANIFAFNFTAALKHHKTVLQALGAGGTAVVGTHAVAAAATVATVAVAAAPFVLGAGAVALVGAGLFKLYETATEKQA